MKDCQDIISAWKILGDENQRKIYDIFLNKNCKYYIFLHIKLKIIKESNTIIYFRLTKILKNKKI
jgi:hypothetical protein